MMRLGNSSLIASLNRQTVDGKCGTKELHKRTKYEFRSFHQMKLGLYCTKYILRSKNSNETFLMYINPFLPQCEGFLLSARQQNCAHFFFFTTSFNHPVDTKLRPIFLLSMLLSGISKSLIKGTQFCFPLRPEPPNECDKSRDFQSLFSDD